MTIALTSSCGFLLGDESGNQLAKGEAEVQLENEKLSILAKFGEAIQLSLVDITEISLGEYRVDMILSSREKLSVFDLGYKFGDFVSNLFNLRNEMILKYLLMNESIKKSGIWGDLAIVDESGTEKRFETCEVRLYETSMVFIPRTREPIRVHFSNIAKADAKDYALSITTESNQTFTMSKMGREFDSTSRDLSEAINTLNLQTLSLLKDLIPFADPSVLRRVSRLLRDGMAARRTDIESISPEVWAALEKNLEQTSSWSGYQHLKSMARQDKIAIGIKRGLMGDLTGNYIWLLVPIHSKNPELGNAIALEAVRIPTTNQKENETPETVQSVEDTGTSKGGNATYFFRMVGRKEYAGFANNNKEFDAIIDNMISTMNQVMLDINFRREPIFLPESTLRTDPRYARYRFAADNIPSLKYLRHHFVGRIIHSSFEQWKSDVMNLLLFNMSTNDDNAKWEKQ
jgi:hypothetical protein